MSQEIKRLTYSEVVDRETAKRLIQTDRKLNGAIILELSDGRVAMPIRYAVLHIIFWWVYTQLGIPIQMRHVFKIKGVYSYKEIFGFFTRIYQEGIAVRPDAQLELKEAIWQSINYLQNFCAVELAEYVSSISIRELVALLDEPKVQAITNVDIREEYGPDAIEATLAAAGKELNDLIGTYGALRNNVLYPYQAAGILNKKQTSQMFIAAGMRTDINDMVVTRPIQESIIGGIRSILSFAIESLSARKAIFYNYEAISDAQYFNRKQQLATSTIRYIFKGDCGSQLVLPFRVTEKNARNLLSKYIVSPTGQLITLTQENIGQYIGHDVLMRSPLLCNHQNGFCEVCGGELTKYITPGLDIGILCATHVVEPVTQKILSTKHLVTTQSVVYVLPGEAHDHFVRQSNMLLWQPNHVRQNDPWWVGIHYNDIQSLRDLQYIERDGSYQEELFSSLQQLWIKNHQGEIVELPLQVNKRRPYLSTDALLYLKEHHDSFQIENDIIWIPMQQFPERAPFMRTAVENDSMMTFVNNVRSFLAKKVGKYRHVAPALRDFSEIVFEKVESLNIMHLEVLLRTYMITSPTDYSTPIVKDPNNVRFSTTPKIISNRSWSAAMSFEDHGRMFANPSTYLIGKDESVWDIHFGFIKGPKL